MRHRKSGIKLNRTGSHRIAMFRNMVTSLLKHERIRTTEAKAKELRRWSDHVITLAKRGDLHARRQVLGIVKDKNTVHDLFKKANERFGDRSGGYTRLTKIGQRGGDAAPMAMVELVTPADSDEKKKKKEKKDKKSKAAAPAGTPAAPAPAADKDRTEEAGRQRQSAVAESQPATESTEEQKEASAEAPDTEKIAEDSPEQQATPAEDHSQKDEEEPAGSDEDKDSDTEK